MKEIIRENLDKLMGLCLEFAKAEEIGDIKRVVEIEAQLVSKVGALDEATIKELQVAMEQLAEKKQAEFKINQERRDQKLAEMDREIDELTAATNLYAEINALMRKYKVVLKRGDLQQAEELKVLIITKSNKLPKEHQIQIF